MRDLHDYLTHDHERLDAFLDATLRDDGSIDEESFAEFRRGLLTHIGIEERILFPLMRARRGPSPLEEQLHRDHALFAALLVLAPAREVIAEIRSVLATHNPLEEEHGGMYEIVEELSAGDLDELMKKVRSYPPVRTAPYADSQILRDAIDRLRTDAAAGRARLLRGRS